MKLETIKDKLDRLANRARRELDESELHGYLHALRDVRRDLEVAAIPTAKRKKLARDQSRD